ncbi:hypothetical protein EN858_21820 [Mesorhizobium sp. M4B.F.Ca.ET.215.01.1.1]|uniref:hypothetical protein n=1 Tax=unclassified Mesorhizobium TaxID=325217 RepID=UPI000FCB8C71|nr:MULTISPECIES: hypothetical protein [unclassified Mesorhizobium]RVD40383.1 hypothetical protein EN741_16760 [Mesorhizobium sp. M4B.F.Ca.ET.019.03.1.1]TGQ08375.1 hypothetical protein EN858_21820 [Mesorhizobium sp. M4B.F.Ca.ET.215.01.1.1]TGQ41048.1 hypothetical protein EN863_021785 [Mesorhizobium sp. M00.F.Ca.ET.220.01.1.1]TGR01932.1 hypothetical protein EN846_18680 [Mesorhizobium sp. M4B.F.Ca.ET.203.01.1.1]TGT45383.1 hypothetical protein EN812_09600 [Mesorhizobium sp. M4B.F.Ca.ET.169.01.1.1]
MNGARNHDPQREQTLLNILDIRPEPPGSGSTLARFDLQLTPTCRLFNLKLVDGPRGVRAYAASAFGTNTATFHPDLADDIRRAALAALGEKTAHDRIAA